MGRISMIRRLSVLGGLAAGVVAILAAWQLRSPAQQAKPNSGRFEFVIVESFDAKYLGDTPGHIGRGAVFGRQSPNLALGDPVYRGKSKIGKVSELKWDQARESLEIEFDPEPFRLDTDGRIEGSQRIALGETVWVRTDGAAAARADR
jgi:hypothetical protein